MDETDLIPPPSGVESYNVEENQEDVFAHADPFELFLAWYKLAKEKEINDPNAMALATVDASGHPNVRNVLMKDVSTSGVSFYTNNESTKGQELQNDARVSLCFFWKSIRRQIRIRGDALRLPEDACNAYFAQRTRGAQIGAWASHQSRPLEEKRILAQRVADFEEIYQGQEVPRPDVWCGYIVRPQAFEFWVDRPFRLHERQHFQRVANGWQTSWLYP